MAAKAVSSESHSVYCQLDPGNGKTNVNLLICDHYLRLDPVNRKVIYVVPNESLMR